MKITELLFRLYNIKKRHLRKIIINSIVRLEGGQMYSPTLRRIYSKYHNIHIGMYSYGSCFDVDNIASGTIIGRYCSFAKGDYIFNGNHPIRHISTHPFFFNTSFHYVDKETISRTKLIIGNDVWIGCNAIILSSVKNIGDGAIIGAGSVVTKDVGENSIMIGKPNVNVVS